MADRQPPKEDAKRALGRYIQLVAVLGTLAIAESAFALWRQPPGYEWLLFAALALLSGSFSMKIASISASITVSDTFFITTALLFGPAPATLVVAIDSFIVSFRRKHSRERVAFNTATPALGMWAGSHAFFYLAGILPLSESHWPVGQLMGPLAALTAIFFLTNSGLIAVAIGLDLRKSPFEIWRQHFSWLSVSCFAAASVAFCLLLLIQEVQISFGAVLVVLPLLIVLHLTLRSSFGRLEDARSHLAKVDRLYLSTVETLAMAIDAKDDVTHSHVRRVQSYSLGLARVLGVNDEPTLKAIEAAALLHDTGKLAVPEHILNKPGKLTAPEFEQMKRHVDVGADILSLVEFPYPVVPIVRCHHENWDGSGYPRGIRGEDIPIGARILSVVDCFDALTSDRPYRSAMTTAQAFEILRARSGTMYEPRVVETFISVQADLLVEVEDKPAHHVVMKQISSSIVPVHAPAMAQPAAAAPVVSDDIIAFVSLARLASGTGSESDVLALASNLMTGLVPDATIAWFLADETSGRLVAVDSAGPAAREVRGLSLAMAEGLSGWVAAQRQSIVNSEAALDLGVRAAQIVPRLESCLSVPLIAGENLVGTVTLYASKATAFDQAQASLIQLLAPHVAQAISTARRIETSAQPPRPIAKLQNQTELRLVSAR